MIVSPERSGERLDKFLSSSEFDVTRARAKKLIDDGCVTVNGELVKASYTLKEGDEVLAVIPEPVSPDMIGEDISLDIIYEDDDIIVVNKPAGMVTHPSAGHYSGTLAHALLGHCGNLSGIGGVARPGIAHRLDKDTSGIIVAAKNDKAHLAISEQLKNRTLGRTYVAVVKGTPAPADGRIETEIGRNPKDRKKMAVVERGGKHAVSHYRLIQELSQKTSLLEVTLETGRTHQIRVHMHSINRPVVGDPMYSRGSGKFAIKRQALHAWRMKLHHPVTGEVMELYASLPKDMEELIRCLDGDPSPYM